MSTMKYLLLLCLLLGACATYPQNQVPYCHAPSQSSALFHAINSHHAYCFINGKQHSMDPYLRDGDIVLTRPYYGEPLFPGQIAIYHHNYWFEGLGTTGRTCHFVLEDNGRAVLFDGIHNEGPPEWVRKDKIDEVVVEIVTFPRPTTNPAKK